MKPNILINKGILRDDISRNTNLFMYLLHAAYKMDENYEFSVCNNVEITWYSHLFDEGFLNKKESESDVTFTATDKFKKYIKVV